MYAIITVVVVVLLTSSSSSNTSNYDAITDKNCFYMCIQYIYFILLLFIMIVLRVCTQQDIYDV